MKKFIIITTKDSEEKITNSILETLNQDDNFFVGEDTLEAENCFAENVSPDEHEDYAKLEVTISLTHTGEVPDQPAIKWTPVKKAK